MSINWQLAEGPLSCVTVSTPVGRLRLSARGAALLSVDWADSIANEEDRADLPVLSQAAVALQQYFQEPRASLAVPLHPLGTPFQRQVWERMASIPAGQLLSYGQLARELGSGPRAVAGACRANPYPLFVPCHRVVSAHGWGGYCGASDGSWLDIKKLLLAHEGVAVDG